MSLALARLIYCLDFRAADATGEGVPGSRVMGREREEKFQIVDMFSSSKEGPVLEFKKRYEKGSAIGWEREWDRFRWDE